MEKGESGRRQLGRERERWENEKVTRGVKRERDLRRWVRR